MPRPPWLYRPGVLPFREDDVILCASGDIHGSLDRFASDLLAFEEKLGVRFNHVLNVGDVGVWPNRQRMDKATRNHGGPGDFPCWFEEQRAVPRPTVFVKGNHEDFVWLAEQRRADILEILPGLRYLAEWRGHGY